MIAAQVLEQVVQGICGTEIGITPEADSCPADFFDQIENIDAFFFANHVAKHTAKHTDVFFFRGFLLGVILICHGDV